MRTALISLSLSMLFPFAVFAMNEVTVPDNVTLTLSGDGSTYTLQRTSQFDSMDVTSTSFNFTLSQGGRVTLISTDRKKLTNSLNKIVSCNSTQSSVDLAIESPYTTTVVTVTPSGTCSAGGGGTGGDGGSSSNSGSSGGGGGGYSPIATTVTVDRVALLKQQIADTQAKIAQKLAQGTNASAGFGVLLSGIIKDLDPGQKGDAVKTLQQLLASDKTIYPEGIMNGVFGPATTRAVKRFQQKYGLAQVGRVGPATRAKFAEIFGTSVNIGSSATQQSANTNPAVSSNTADQASKIQDQIKLLQAQILQIQVKALQDKINSVKK